jgi:iron complex outermembrane recepter protein
MKKSHLVRLLVDTRIPAGLALVGVMCAVHAQAPAPAPQKLDKVEITGSSIKQIEGETALPVLVITREEIQRTGAANAEELLRSIATNSSGGSSSVANTGAGGGQGGGSSASLISMRGLGSARTLVLLNGRRTAPAGGSSAIDVSTIPIAAIERIEVLRDGASAVYGSDAVAGVVNFILRKDFAGRELSVSFGTPTRAGGGDDVKASLFMGFGDLSKERFNINVGASYQKVKPIFGSDRSFASNLNVGEQLDRTSNTPFPASVVLPSNLALRSPNYPNCGPYSLVSPLQPTSPGNCRYDNSPYVAIQPLSEQWNGLLTGRLKLTESVEAYVESNFTRNTTTNTIQHVLINGAALTPTHPYTSTLRHLLTTRYAAYPALRRFIGSAYSLLPPDSPYYPAAFAAANGLAGQPLVLQFRSIPTGQRVTEDVTDNARIVAGVRGTGMGWDYDGSFLYAKNKISESLVDGWPLFNQYLTLLNSGVINPFGTTTDPAALAAAQATIFRGNWFVNTTSVTSFNASGSRELFQLPAGAVNLAIGGEIRKEKLDLAPSQTNKDFLVAGFGGAGVPLNADRDVKSAYAEVNIPIVKGLEANAAVRYDNYQRIGNTTNPKFSIRWQPAEAVLLRAAVGTGFRAPTLVDLYSPVAFGITTNGQRDLVRCPLGGPTTDIDCSNQFVTINGGNAALKPEKSKSTTLGLVFEPNKEFSIGIDSFQIKLKDVIRTGVPVATILANPITYAALIQRGPPDGNPSGVGRITGISQQLINLGKVNVAGYDLDIKARLLNGPEYKVTARASGTYMDKYETQNLDGSFSNAINVTAGTTPGVILRWRHTASITLERGDWSATMAQNFQNAYYDTRTALQAATVPLRTVAPYETFDLQASYGGFKSLRLVIGVKNVLDRDPPYANSGSGFIGSYDLSYADVRGRFVYTNLTYRF